MKEFKFNIPTTKTDFANYYRIAKIKVFGHRCKSCGARLKYGTQYHSGMLNGKSFIMGGNGLCDKCLKKQIQDTAFLNIAYCHWCGKHTSTYKFMFNKFSLGAEWWNGFHGCKACILEGFEKTPLVSSMYRYDKKTKTTKPV